MVNSKNSLNLKQSKNTLQKSIYSNFKVDSLTKKQKIIPKINKEILIIKKEPLNIGTGIKLNNINTSVDDSKRMFLKVAGVAGLGLAASALFPKSADAYVSGSTPTSNVVGIKNITNTKINPATEDTLATLATESTLNNIKTQSDKLTFDGSSNLLTKGSVSVSNITNTQINPATEESLINVGQSVNDQSVWMLRKILTLLKPLGMTTGAQSNRLSVDVNNLVGGSVAISSGTISSLTNLANIGNVNAFSLMKDSARNAYANSIRNKISF